MEKQKCPEVRFKGYDQNWRLKKLEAIGIFNPYSNLPQEFEYVDLESVVGTELINSRKETIETAPSRAQRLASRGDVFYQAVRPYQKNNYLFDLPYDNYVFSTGYIQIRPTINSYYLLSIVQKNDFVQKVLENCTGTSYPAINTTGLKSIDVFISNEANEQTQIGNFFQNLDQSITLQEKKLAQTQNLKKAMLEKMFPKAGSVQPEIRLKKFSGDWALQPLENIFGKIRNAFVGTATPYYVKSGRFYLESNNVKDGKINRKSEIFINDYFYYKQQDKWLKTNDIVMVQSGHVGHAAVITEQLNNSAAHALIMFTDYKVDADPHFINYQIQTDNAKNEIDKITTGNTIKHILSSDMKKFSLLFPCVKEQEKIGHFFKQLDETLALQHQQLQTLKNLKQAFLEKMFV